MSRVDYEQVSVVYQEGRSIVARPDELGRLIDLPRRDGLRVLDVGAGTGIFTRAWPTWGASLVIGLDPSAAMLSQAGREGLPARAALVSGAAESLPFGPRTFDAAWLSAVIHHLDDHATVARELARVLVPAGTVYIRGFFADSSHLDWLAFFPGSERAVARFPTIVEVARGFGQAGFHLVRADEIPEPPARVQDVQAWINKMRHADTLLTALTDNEVNAGMTGLGSSKVTHLGGRLHMLTLTASG